jgi:hypothetical protein
MEPVTNPWLQLPAEPPYVLSADAPFIDRFNERVGDSHRIRPEVIPEPYLGNPGAPVVLLNLNPGFVDDDRQLDLNPRFNDAARASLEHRHPAWPFYLLDPTLPDSPGRNWWMKKLRALIAVTSVEAVARHVFVIEVHGYHSRRFSPRLKVPSQEYTRSLVVAALTRGALLVVMRGLRHWLELVPALRGVESLAVVRNVQNPTISPGNLANFDRIVEAVRA